jgi:hypothetical protein
VRAVVAYKVEDKAGNVSPETLAVAIPVKVAPPYKAPSDFVKALRIAGEIVMAIPLYLTILFYCPECPNC